MPPACQAAWNYPTCTAYVPVPGWEYSAYGGIGLPWWEATFPYYKAANILLCPDQTSAAIYSSTSIRPSYGLNINMTTIPPGCTGPLAWTGISVAKITSPTTKIMISELRASVLPDYLGYLRNDSYGFWSEPAIVDTPGTNATADLAANGGIWYSGDPVKARHSQGCIFGFADGHVKWMTNQPGLLYVDTVPSTDVNVQHYWNPASND